MMFTKISAASILWICIVMVTALAIDIHSLKGWLAVGAFALVPSAMLMHFGRPVPLTTSEAISEARR